MMTMSEVKCQHVGIPTTRCRWRFGGLVGLTAKGGLVDQRELVVDVLIELKSEESHRLLT